jgi:hypothetical protein
MKFEFSYENSIFNVKYRNFEILIDWIDIKYKNCYDNSSWII